MNKSHSKIRHTQNVNVLLENRYLIDKNDQVLINEAFIDDLTSKITSKTYCLNKDKHPTIYGLTKGTRDALIALIFAAITAGTSGMSGFLTGAGAAYFAAEATKGFIKQFNADGSLLERVKAEAIKLFKCLGIDLPF